MDIYVFDKGFNKLGLIDTYDSLIWRRKFYKSGNFELHGKLPKTDVEVYELIQLLKKGNILRKDDSPEDAAYIEDVVLDEQDQETFIVSGFFINNFISERIVWGRQAYRGTIEQVMKNFIAYNCITPNNTDRIIPNLALSSTRGITINADEVNSYGNLAELMENLATKYDVGWRVLFDLVSRSYVFDVYDGKDLTVNQSINPQAIFSLEYENVFNQTFTDSNDGFKNMALIAGQGEGAARKIAVIDEGVSGFERRELYVDARDIEQENEDGTPIPDADYEKMLISRGQSKLAELQPIQTFESGISVLSNLVYKRDFDLGDKVTIQNYRWGVTLNTRITEIEEVYEGHKMDIRVNFGSNIPTIMDKIKQKMG